MATRKKRRPRYINPKAPKDQGSGARKKFIVKPHASIHVKDEDGVVRKYSGRQAELNASPEEGVYAEPVTVMLTEELASFYANLGYIEVELDFAADKDSEIATLRQENASLSSELGEAEALRRRIEELEAQLAGGTDVHSDGESDPADDAAVSAIVSSGASSSASSDGAEDGSGDNAVSGGAESSSGPSSGSEPETAPRVARRRRKAG